MILNMMQMVGLMVVCYLIALTSLCVYRKLINNKVANIVFMAVDALFFMAWTYASYINGWNESGFLMFDNISPFIMTIIPLTLFLNEKAREYCNCAIAFLWFGMLVALVVSPGRTYLGGSVLDASFGHTTEAACHLIVSLYGTFLIVSGQVKCNLQSLKKACIFIFSAIGIGVVFNYLMHKGNFGMNPYGDFSIYMLEFFDSFEKTFAAYLLGVLAVLSFGMLSGAGLYRLVCPKDDQDDEEDDDEDEDEAEYTQDEEETNRLQ